ncbi:MAG: DUF3667 domain-containing protein [Sphingobacteriales bacterium]|nr:MAG: DUF3667 domain-containing protein [Sphingobacteriales bacterium]
MHFFNDLTHFDGKFFETLKLLLIRPGFISDAYIRGQRTKYLDPIRMYLFVSAIFLLFAVTFISTPDYVNVSEHPEYKSRVDSLRKVNYADKLSQVTIEEKAGYDIYIINLPENMRHGKKHYDSVRLAEGKKRPQGLMTSYVTGKVLNMYQSYDANPYNFFPKAIKAFLSSLSKIFFISLPVFVMLLSFIYISGSTNKNAVAHGIFSLHYYSVSFIIIIILSVISWAFSTTSFAAQADNMIFLVWQLGLFIYLFLAMKRFYRQGLFKTFLKSLFLYVCAGIFIVVVTGIFFVNSFLSAY